MKKIFATIMAALTIFTAATPAEAANYPDFTYAAESCIDAVVYVGVTIPPAASNMQIDLFRFFFGDEGFGQQPQSREQRASGSGVIISEDGYIVTNNHVVANASQVEVTLNNNKTYKAKVVGTDPATDIAVVKIEANGLKYLKLADSDKLRLGQWVLAIGSPYELKGTVTAGIVSAKGRSMPNYTGEFKIESFIQTDAAVNPGNSGGALVNLDGELVGINTAILSRTGAYAGYSFAVPTNIVKSISGDIIKYGSVRRAMLGIVMSPIDEKTASELKLSSRDGVYINEVSSGSAAEKAGVKKGDVLIEIDGAKLTTPSSVQEKVTAYHPGDKAVLTLLRDGKLLNLRATFQGSTQETGTVNTDGGVAFYGSVLKEASKETLSRLGIKSGVEIVSVGPGKMRNAGASEGFIIQYVNDRPVKTAKEVIDIAKNSRRSVFLEGVTVYGKASYFGFGKDE